MQKNIFALRRHVELFRVEVSIMQRYLIWFSKEKHLCMYLGVCMCVCVWCVQEGVEREKDKANVVPQNGESMGSV